MVEDLITIDAAINGEGQDSLGTPLKAGAQSVYQWSETGTQVIVVIGAFEVDRVSFGGVDIVTVDDFIGPFDCATPAFEDVLHTCIFGCVLVVGPAAP